MYVCTPPPSPRYFYGVDFISYKLLNGASVIEKMQRSVMHALQFVFSDYFSAIHRGNSHRPSSLQTADQPRWGKQIFVETTRNTHIHT